MSSLLNRITGFQRFYHHIPSRMVQAGLMETTVFNIDNVYEYWLSHDDITLHPHHFPNCAPVLDNMFFEMYDPKEHAHLGVLVGATDFHEDRHPHFSAAFQHDVPRWILLAYPFAEAKGYMQELSPLIWSVCLQEDGRILEFNNEEHCLLSFGYADESRAHLLPTDEDAWWAREFNMYAFMCPVFLALSFMHCKNVERIAHHQPRPERRRLLKEGRHKEVEAVFYTLEIDPMKKVLRDEGQVETLGLKRALHITRGHFAEYGPEFGKGKLFGKFEGRYWIPQHVKGSAEFGEIRKDYSVKAPSEERHG